MSEETCTKLEKDFCRCCHSYGQTPFKSLYKSFIWFGNERIVLSELLQECFNIEVVLLEGPLSEIMFKICNTCIKKLQEAMQFKRQVEKCEQQFRVQHKQFIARVNVTEELLGEIKVELPEYSFDEIKIELPELEECNNPLSNDGITKADDQIKAKKKPTTDTDDGVSDPWDETDFNSVDAERQNALRNNGITKADDKKKAKKKPSTDEEDDGLSDPWDQIDFDSIAEDHNDDMLVNPNGAADDHNSTLAYDGRDDDDDDDGDNSYLSELRTNSNLKMNIMGKKNSSEKSTGAKLSKPKRNAKRTEKAEFKTPKPTCDLEGVEFKLIGDTWQCNRCSMKSKTRHLVRKHVRKIHLKLPTLNCPLCPKKFFTVAPLVKHKLDDHNVDERAKCNACEQVFTKKGDLNAHMNTCHMLGKKMKCTECDFECFSNYRLKKHMDTHNHRCKYCKKEFLRKKTLMLHEKIHAEDRRKVCTVCGQAFDQKTSLNYHMTKYHPEVAF